tara:strand:- start:429 stop:5528 length:5100 start_codon:yes stop_codon:yes gene_type:complete
MTAQTIFGIGQKAPPPEAEQARKTIGMFPDATGQRTLTQSEFIASMRPGVEDMQLAPDQERFDATFEKILSGEIDGQTIFSQPLFKKQENYDRTKAAYAAQKGGTSTPDDDAFLEMIRNSSARRLFDYYTGTTQGARAATGIVFTPTLPLDRTTGEVILPEGAPDLTQRQKNRLTRQAEDAQSLSEFLQGKTNLPTDPRVLDAVYATFDGSQSRTFAERIYSLGSATVEAGGYWAPIASQWFVGLGENNEMFSLPEDLDSKGERQVALRKFRASQDWLKNRRQVVEGMLRDHLRATMGDQAYEEAYGKKITLDDGTEMFETELISDSFAEQISEQMFDMQDWKFQLAAFMGENIIAYNALKRPFQAVKGAIRIGRQIKHGPNDVPFSLMNADQRIIAINQVSRSKGLSATAAASALIEEEKAFKVFAGLRKKFLLGTTQRQLAAREMNELKGDGLLKIRSLQTQIGLIGTGSGRNTAANVAKLKGLRAELRLELDRQNWRMVQSMYPGAMELGINPVFDSVVAIAQYAGRQKFGPIGELMGAGGIIGSYGVYKTFSLSDYGTAPLIRSVAGFAQNTAYRAKEATESLVNLGFSLATFSARALTGDPTISASARGFLINPNIRAYLKLTDSQKNSLPKGINQKLLQFTEGLKAFNPEAQEMIIKNLDQSFTDIRNIASSIPENLMMPSATDPTKMVNVRNQVQKSLALGFGEMSGTNFYIAAAKVEPNRITPSKVLLSVDNSIRAAVANQVATRERQATLSASIDSFNATMLGLKKVADDPKQAIETRQAATVAGARLENLSQMFADSQTMLAREAEILAQNHAELVNSVLNRLKNPLNREELHEAVMSGTVRDALELLRRTQRSVLPESAQPSVVKQDFIDQKILEAMSVDEQINTLNQALLKFNESMKIGQFTQAILKSQDDTILSLNKLNHEQHDQIIKAAYDKIPSEENIEVNVGVTQLLSAFKAMRVDKEASVATLANPSILPSLGGRVGTKLLEALQRGSRNGLRRTFSDPKFLEEFSAAYGGDRQFTTADEVIEYFKLEHYGDRVRADGRKYTEMMGVTSKEDITDLHLMLFMIDDAELSSLTSGKLNFVVSAEDLESLRQGMSILRNSTNEDSRNLGKAVIDIIDNEIFPTWGNTLDVEAYNDVIRARTLARLSFESYERSTIGAALDKMVAGQDNLIGAPDLTVRPSSTVIDPLFDAIMRGDAKSISVIDLQLDRLKATFAPMISTLPENVLVKGQDGRFIQPDTDQIRKMVGREMDEKTYNIISSLLNAKLRQASIGKSPYQGYNNFLNALARNMEDNTLPRVGKEDLPAAMPIPPEYNGNLTNYMQAIMDNSAVIVNGEQKFLLDPFNNMIAADITEVVNANQSLQRAHFGWIETAKELEIEFGGLAAAQEKITNRIYAASGIGEKASGSGFYKILMDDSPNSVKNYLDLVRSPGFISRAGEGVTDDTVTEALQALVSETLRHVGDASSSGDTVRLFDGLNVPVESYKDPFAAYELITEAIEGTTSRGRKFAALAEEAGISIIGTKDSPSQLQTLQSVYRYGTMLGGSSYYDQIIKGRAKFDETAQMTKATKGFTLDNALSKAFNIARGMVSPQFVAADIALRYAAISGGRALEVILNDSRVSEIIYNVLNDVDKVVESDAVFLSKQIAKSLAGDPSFSEYVKAQEFDVDSIEYARQFYENIGINIQAP